MRPETNSTFHWLDYTLFIATLAVSLGIGVFQALTGGRQKTTQEYLLGNRQLSMIPVSISMFMSFFSSIMVLGNTAEMYTRGVQFWLAFVGSSLGYLISIFVFVPLLFPLKLTSAYEVRTYEHIFRAGICVKNHLRFNENTWYLLIFNHT